MYEIFMNGTDLMGENMNKTLNKQITDCIEHIFDMGGGTQQENNYLSMR